MEAEKPKRGRPALPAGERKAVITAFKMTEAENTAISRASSRAGKDKSSWIRETLLEAAGV